MSKLSEYNILQSIFTAKKFTKFNLDGRPCKSLRGKDGNNYTTILQAVNAWTHFSNDLMIRLNISMNRRHARISHMLDTFYTCDILAVNALCADLYTYFITNEIYVYDDVKVIENDHASRSENLLKVLEPIRLHINTLVSACTSKDDIFYLRLRETIHWLCFLSKLSFDNPRLEEEAISSYLAVEEGLRSFSDTEASIELMQFIADWVGYTFKDFKVDLRPKHGGGATADCSSARKCAANKYAASKIDKKLEIILTQSGGVPLSEYFPDKVRLGSLNRCSKTVFVPKNIKKLRTISMEPSTIQYFQQPVMTALYKYFSRHRYLKHHIKLKDQTFNNHLAMIGSRDRSYCTIDLSAASDSVSHATVKAAFSKAPQVLKYLVGLRSTHTKLPDGRIVELAKYAPMGSALCFPVECIIFAAIVEYSLNRMSGHSGAHHETWSVYGDDIIVPNYAYQEVVNNLTHLGFSVNMEKSYHTGSFRESCGKDFYDGYDVTRYYWRSKPMNTKKPNPASFASWISAANAAYSQEYYGLRLYCVHTLLSCNKRNMKGGGVGFTDDIDDPSMVYSKQPTNFHLKSVYSKRFQCSRVKIACVKARQIVTKQSEAFMQSCGYFEWLKANSGVTEELTVEIPRFAMISPSDATFGVSWAYAHT